MYTHVHPFTPSPLNGMVASPVVNGMVACVGIETALSLCTCIRGGCGGGARGRGRGGSGGVVGVGVGLLLG